MPELYRKISRAATGAMASMSSGPALLTKLLPLGRSWNAPTPSATGVPIYCYRFLLHVCGCTLHMSCLGNPLFFHVRKLELLIYNLA